MDTQSSHPLLGGYFHLNLTVPSHLTGFTDVAVKLTLRFMAFVFSHQLLMWL